MRVLIAGGGTAGHINPAIAIAQKIRKEQPDAEIYYAGTPHCMEATLVPKAGFPFLPIQVAGFHRSFRPKEILYNCRSLYYLMTSSVAARRMVKKINPDVVIGTGGYVAGPVVLAGVRAHKKTMIHEQNAFPGVTNKILAKQVDVVLLATEAAKDRMEIAGKCAVVGNPLRSAILEKTPAQAKKELGLDSKMTVLSVGGSLGARIINQMGADLMEWNRDGSKINHIHGYGSQGKEIFPQMLKERGLSMKPNDSTTAVEYIDNMATVMAAVDLVITRCGASTLSELEAMGKPTILVPSPYVAENHQYHNGMVLVHAGAAYLIEEKKYNKEEFLQMVEDFCAHPEKLAAFGKAAKKLGVTDTTERIYRLLMELVEKG